MNLKCIHCIERYIRLPESEKTPVAWEEVQDSVTMAPSWQQMDLGMGQLVMACVALPVCLDHIRVDNPQPLASSGGLVLGH